MLALKKKRKWLYLFVRPLNGGYAESDIAIESFEIDDSTPMMDEAIQNVFDGGEKVIQVKIF